jgi:hypothetical protein
MARFRQLTAVGALDKLCMYLRLELTGSKAKENRG